jgi:hypothetical protein
VKKVDIETLPRNDERELFRDYIEDYNTGGGSGLRRARG